MRTIVFALLFLLALTIPLSAQTASATFGWTPPVTAISGVQLQFTSTQGASSFNLDCTAPASGSCTAPAIASGSWVVVAVPYNEGIPASLRAYGPVSSAVPFTIPATPGALNGFTITKVQITISTEPTNVPVK